ncbi:TusE/DsrC/DsvC family sulfur relay protein [Thiohalobacter thiocyanaticus]|uniref:Sulfurtransferase n=1 Tax=Thiohalobacter thiocyanaticus TaxID=585455 RepID=A0A426QE73_9GAMM|nr:TusE/DsrC/DsvC family sulfur relay protein [Thiohalobacter thiocyanaticus]RRQ20058.1 TusE/DsrC/DsvC family sulfur relay protein [Thiohalobacter thiocyanaticus]
MSKPPLYETPDKPVMADPSDPMSDLEEWSESRAHVLATEEGITLSDEHMALLHGLRELYRKNPHFHAREALECMEDRTAANGGKKHLYELFPKGPVRQACKIAGLPVPADAKNESFGSVM